MLSIARNLTINIGNFLVPLFLSFTHCYYCKSFKWSQQGQNLLKKNANHDLNVSFKFVTYALDWSLYRKENKLLKLRSPSKKILICVKWTRKWRHHAKNMWQEKSNKSNEFLFNLKLSDDTNKIYWEVPKIHWWIFPCMTIFLGILTVK